MSKNIKPIKYKESSKYPAISKDMAFIVKENEVIPFKKVVIEKEDVEDEK